MMTPHPLVERVGRYLTSHDLLMTRSRVLVGVSGGSDSIALLHLLLALKQRQLPGLQLHVAHLDHGLRGADGAADAAAVAHLAAAWGVPATVEQRDVGRYRTAHKLSVEQAAREVRYRFFAEVARRVSADRVAVGHTADDLVETVLLHVVRGAGTQGLRGILPAAPLPYAGAVAALTLIRPLLEVSRAETEGYCWDLALPVREDPTNRSPAFLRNRVRHELLPLLETFNPRARVALLRLAHQAQDELAFLEGQIEDAWPDLARVGPDRVALDLDYLVRLPRALQRYALRRALTVLLGDLHDLTRVHVDDMIAALGKPVGTQLSLPRGARFFRDYGQAVLSRVAVARGTWPPLEHPYPVPVPGSVSLPGWTVSARLEEVHRSPEIPPASGDRWQVALDADALRGPLFLRPRRPGDRFRPLGLEGTKKLQDFLVDARIPRACRDRVPLLVAADRILWVVGWRIDHEVRLTPATRRLLLLECRPQQDTHMSDDEMRSSRPQ